MKNISLLAPRLFAGVGTLTLLAATGLLASRPAHTAGGPIPVSVANTPLATTTADSSAKQPFMGFTAYTISNGARDGLPDSPTYSPMTVPDGKRLVIQTVSMYRYGQTSGESVSSFIAPFVSGQNAGYYALPLVPDTGTDTPGVTQAVTLYADPGKSVNFEVHRSGTTGTEDDYFSVTGYLVDIP